MMATKEYKASRTFKSLQVNEEVYRKFSGVCAECGLTKYEGLEEAMRDYAKKHGKEGKK